LHDSFHDKFGPVPNPSLYWFPEDCPWSEEVQSPFRALCMCEGQSSDQNMELLDDLLTAPSITLDTISIQIVGTQFPDFIFCNLVSVFPNPNKSGKIGSSCVPSYIYFSSLKPPCSSVCASSISRQTACPILGYQCMAEINPFSSRLMKLLSD